LVIFNLAVFPFLAMGSFSVVKTYPMSCLSALAAIFILAVIVRFRSERGRLTAEVAKVCRMAQRRLQDAAPAKVLVLHLRDEIAWELYPNAEADRKHLKTNVWPRVMQDFGARQSDWERISRSYLAVAGGVSKERCWGRDG
jgi:hypothetical protein